MSTTTSDRPEPFYPDVTVQLTGLDGNIGSIMARVRDAIAAAGEDTNVMNQLWLEVMEADSYPQAVQAVMKVVNVE